MPEQKTYVPKSSCKSMHFPASLDKPAKSILKLGFHAETLIAFVKEHANERGYINFGISKMKEPKFNSTHAVWLDTWEPRRTESE